MQRKKVKGSLTVTANTLGDGLVVFRTAHGTWSPELGDAAVLTQPEHADGALAAAENDATRNIVLNPYLIEMTAVGGGWQPSSLRERIRAHGPTIEAASLDAYEAP
jgi:hypothetical protein